MPSGGSGIYGYTYYLRGSHYQTVGNGDSGYYSLGILQHSKMPCRGISGLRRVQNLQLSYGLGFRAA